MPTRLTKQGLKSPKLLIEGRYEFVCVLGQGASSLVAEVKDQSTNERRALKILQAHGKEQLLQHEFARLSLLSHPNLVQVFDVGRLSNSLELYDQAEVFTPGTLFLVLDLLKGKSPREFLITASEPQRTIRFYKIAHELASALDYLHAHGLVHHDVKPQNVLLDNNDNAVLIDFGLAAIEDNIVQGTAPIRGTISYMAPEALGGEGGRWSDIYSLGATLYFFATGHNPFEGSGAELIRQILEDEPDLQVDWLDKQGLELVHWLLQKDPQKRPTSCRTILAELARIRGDHCEVVELTSRPHLLQPAFVGRKSELRLLTDLFIERSQCRVSEKTDSRSSKLPAAVLIVGAPGSGKSRLINEAVRQQRICFAAKQADSLVFESGLPKHSFAEKSSLEETVINIVDGLEKQAKNTPVILHLPNIDEDSLQQSVLDMLLGSAEATGDSFGIMAVAEVSKDSSYVKALCARTPLVKRLDLALLSNQDICAIAESMTGRELNSDEVVRLQSLAQGLPVLAIEVIRYWAEQSWGKELDKFQGLEELLSGRRQWMAEINSQLMDILAVYGEPLCIADLVQLVNEDGSKVLLAIDELCREQIVTFANEQVSFLCGSIGTSWLTTIAKKELTAIHCKLAKWLGGLASKNHEILFQLARHQLGSGDLLGVKTAIAIGKLAKQRSDPARAIPILEKARELADPQTSQTLGELLADFYIQTANYNKALVVLDALDDPCYLLRARTLQRKGDYDAAVWVLQKAILEVDEEDEQKELKAVLGRILLWRGQAAKALKVSEQSVEELLNNPKITDGDISLLEICGLACLYLGNTKRAEQLFDFGEKCSVKEGRLVEMARFMSLRGMVAMTLGLPLVAADFFNAAYDHASKAGDIHAIATYKLNLGCVLIELGQYQSALEYLVGVIKDLGRLGRTGELASAQYNLAKLLLLLFDLDQVEHVLSNAKVLAKRLGSRRVQGYVVLLKGDLCRRRGKQQDAMLFYEQAMRVFNEDKAEREEKIAKIACTEVLIELGQIKEAKTKLKTLQDSKIDPKDIAVIWGRLYLRMAQDGLSVPNHKIEQITKTLIEHCACLHKQGAATELWRAALVLSSLFAILGKRHAAMQRVLKLSMSCWEKIMSKAPEPYQKKMQNDPDAVALTKQWKALLKDELEDVHAESSLTKNDNAQRYKRLLAINKRLNSELNLPRLLEMIIDTVIDLTDAERGFLILVEDDKTFSIKVARNIDKQSLDKDELALSRSIAEQAALTGEPVVTVDALDDGRFKDALSVDALRLRSVLAVPLAVKGRVVGTIYVDHRLRRGAFSEHEVELVLDLADQAAIAIDNARLLTENKQHQEEIEKLNERLSETVKDQEQALVVAREEIRSNRQALKARYNYSNIIGQTPRMLELFRLLDRITDTDLPVVIQGESGTGKELVARAIHFNGKRANRPFVGENCSAIPETLLESVLFGHKRGAFTGADRDRRGLFEVANGGTLFLDEVGEMSAGMQKKLLRVLQNGEFRPVGDERIRTTDVRVVAASNKELADLVANGKFREDLFYRLNVVRIEIPLLCDRREDIPLLVEYFLQKYSSERPRKVSKQAMALLMGYSWPGNVRELENEIMRAIALSDEIIVPEDFSSNICSGSPLTLLNSEDLSMRPRIEHMERELIKRALDRTDGNQSKAARLLGLSRFGLLKKLKRYFP